MHSKPESTTPADAKPDAPTATPPEPASAAVRYGMTHLTTPSKIVSITFSCSIEGDALYLAPTTDAVIEDRAEWTAKVEKTDSVIIRIADPEHGIVLDSLTARSSFNEGAWTPWTRVGHGVESPKFAKPGTVEIELAATPASSPIVGPTGAVTTPTQPPASARTTSIIIIRKPGMPPPEED